MKRSALWLALAALWSVTAGASDFLPSDEQARAVLDGLPSVHAAQARYEEAGARGEAIALGSHEFVIGVMPMTRHEAGRPPFPELEASVSRALRWPEKQRLDKVLGERTVETAKLVLADARHAGARLLLDAWMNWLRAAASVDTLERQWHTLEEEQRVLERRLRQGDLAQLELEQAAALSAQAQLALERARATRDELRLGLMQQFPGLTVPETTPVIPTPAPMTVAGEDLATKLVAHDVERRIAEAIARHQGTVAERAQAERTPDPTVGLRVTDDKDNREQSFGLTFSMPLAGGYRASTALAEAHLASAAEAEAEAVTLRIQTAARQLVQALTTRRLAWESAVRAEQSSRAASMRIERAWQLGELGFAERALARRQAQEAELAELQARLDVHAVRLRVEVDSHQRWLQEESEDSGDAHP